MKERGNSSSFSAAITVVSAIVAPFIPPSIPMVVYAYLSNNSVARMFLAGILPSFLIVVCLMVFNRYLAGRNDGRKSLNTPVPHPQRRGMCLSPRKFSGSRQ